MLIDQLLAIFNIFQSTVSTTPYPPYRALARTCDCPLNDKTVVLGSGQTANQWEWHGTTRDGRVQSTPPRRGTGTMGSTRWSSTGQRRTRTDSLSGSTYSGEMMR